MSNAITSEQRTWLKDLGRMVGAPAGVEASEDDAEADGAKGDDADGEGDGDAPRGSAPKGVRGEQTTKSLLGLPIPLPESIVSQITIRNKSDAVIELVDGSAKLENVTASFVDSPPFDVPAGSDKTFSVTNAVAGTAVGGTGGEVRYTVAGDAKKVLLFLKWERGGILPSRKATATLTPSDPRFEIKGRNSGENFQFEFAGKGGNPNPNPGPNPNPNPGLTPTPGPAVANVPSSCMIIVTNTTDVPLIRSATGHDRGNFGVPAPRTINANSSVAFSSVETPGAKEQGCKGFIEWQVGTPAVAVWRTEWDNPEQQKNTSSASLTPQTAGFSSQDIIGQGDENVPVNFTLSGGGPGPGPDPEPDPPFEPPVEAKQPTFRKGDKSSDGWVEYAQLLLNFHLKAGLKEDGDFGAATLAAVLKFQKLKDLQVDGTIGNQTWAALREGAPEKPSTDGRQPHTFVEKGQEARWVLESQTNNLFRPDSDLLTLAVQSVGDTPLDKTVEATVRVTPPGAKPRVLKVPIGEPTPSTTKAGFTHEVGIQNFRKRFPSVPPDVPVTDYLVEAFLPKELGGDLYSGKVRQK